MVDSQTVYFWWNALISMYFHCTCTVYFCSESIFTLYTYIWWTLQDLNKGSIKESWEHGFFVWTSDQILIIFMTKLGITTTVIWKVFWSWWGFFRSHLDNNVHSLNCMHHLMAMHQPIAWIQSYTSQVHKHSKKVLTKAIWADKKWAGFWQISLYIK